MRAACRIIRAAIFPAIYPVIRSLFLCCLLAITPAFAAAPTAPPAPAVPVKSWAILDADSGQLLAGHNADQRLQPASLTKLMTAYVAFEALKAGHIRDEDAVRVSEAAWRRGYVTRESRMFLELNSTVSVTDLLRGVLVQSGNDASVALAEHVAGSESDFVELMNRYAAELGMKHSHFTNATGVPDTKLLTTAHDLARLSRALIKDFPDRYGLFSEREFTYNNILQRNRNPLLKEDIGVDGLKTGHHDSAGYCLAASARRDGRRLIAVVLGAQKPRQRADAVRTLLDYGFRFFETATPARARVPLLNVRVWKGEQPELSLGLAHDLRLSVPRGTGGQLRLETVLTTPVLAPVAAGQIMGTLNVKLGTDIIRSEPLVSLAAVPEGGLWRRSIDALRLRFRESP